MNPADPTATHAPQLPADPSEADWDAGLAAAFGLPEKQPRPAVAEPEVGAVLAGKYRLTERIGEGGMGSVWVAQQTEPVKRRVAIKLIKAGMDSKSVLARFEAERQALAVMDHPNIAKVLDGGLHDGRPFFVMELVKGVPITDYCDARKLTPRERLELFLPVCHAIQHAHQKGIIHRDIKPSNVLIALYDDRPVPKVIDFGVAKATGAALTEHTIETAFGGVIGTPQYMSPEQATLNNLDIDTRSDVYSLGVLLYELLTGSPPFARKDLEQQGLLEMLRVVREVEPPKPSTKLSTAAALPTLAANRGTEPGKLTKLLRSELDWIILKALEKDRSRRYETANGFAADINRYLSGEPVIAHPPTLGYRVRKVCDRNRVAIVIAFTFAVTLLTASLISLLQMSRATRAELIAERQRDEAEAEKNRAIKSEAEALAAQKRADAAKAEAQAKAAEANAVVTFFEDKVFAAGRPKGEAGGLGHDVSLRDAVRASLPSLATGFKDQPLVEARLRLALGNTFHRLGHPTEAATQEERARALFTSHRGPDHLDTVVSMHNLAGSYAALGRHAEALKLREETLAAQRRVLPPDHPDTLKSMNNLALSYFALGRHAEALKLREETLAAQKRLLPPDHPDTLKSMNNLASSYATLGRHAEALKLYEETLAAQRRVLPPNHPDTLLSMHNLASSYAALNRHAEALTLLDDVLARADRPGVDPSLLSGALSTRVRCCQKLGDLAGCRAGVERLEKRNPTGAASLYNAACGRAVTATLQAKARDPDAARLAREDADKAMAWLEKAVAAGWTNVAHMKKDADLDFLRHREDFKKLVAELEKKLPPPKETAPPPRVKI